MATDAQVADLFSWQIGSKGPPKVCLCCGLAFDEDAHRIHGPYRTAPYIWVCEACWLLPFLFFPDKVGMFARDVNREGSIPKKEHMT